MFVSIEQALYNAGLELDKNQSSPMVNAARIALDVQNVTEATHTTALLQHEFIIDCIRILSERIDILEQNCRDHEEYIDWTIETVKYEYDGRLPDTWKMRVNMSVVKDALMTYTIWFIKLVRQQNLQNDKALISRLETATQKFRCKDMNANTLAKASIQYLPENKDNFSDEDIINAVYKMWTGGKHNS